MKILILILFFLFLNGCLQNTAFLGPAVTVASSGNIAQAGLSYSSNLAIKKITGKTPIENVKLMLQPKDNENKIITSAKNKIKEVSKIEDLSNQ
ncbi:hypothetical protein OAM18_05275 [Candidatus Pelagibacter sp.]|nr:hypothetical protein [Candidatus Pelagibacter sp.]